MKRRIVTIAVSFLLCIGMIGAGFAAWIITGNTEQATSGAIEVQEVVDNRIVMNGAWKDVNEDGQSNEDDAKIIFGKHATDTCSWLANDSDEEEKLTATYVITVTNHEELVADGLTYTFNCTLEATDLDETNAENGYENAAPTLVGALPTVSAVAVNGQAGVYEVAITFTWGTAFGGVNPLTYYKDTTYDKDTADTATENLQNLHKYLTSVGYKLTITGTVS